MAIIPAFQAGDESSILSTRTILIVIHKIDFTRSLFGILIAMSYKLLVLAPSAGGKSTTTRYLRDNTDLNIVETDEEVVRANGGEWPETGKDKELVYRTAKQIIDRDNLVYFMKDMPLELLREAREKGFTVINLSLSLDDLLERNEKRIREEGYQDASRWFEGQLRQLEEYRELGLFDYEIDASQTVGKIAEEIVDLAS
jgi:hypothetical protein